MTNDKELVSLYVVRKDDDEELLKQQELRLKKYCELKGYQVQEVYTDSNRSKLDMNRPELQRLLNDVKQGNVKYILTCKINLINPCIDELMTFIRILFSNECCFETLDNFNMLSYLGKTRTSLFTFFGDFKNV